MYKNRDDSGFSLVEVLVGIVMLSLAVMTMSGALRQLYQWKYRQASYEVLYETVDSLIDEITGMETIDNIEGIGLVEGVWNGVSYEYRCEPLSVVNNYLYTDDPLMNGNNGRFRIALQECSLRLKVSQLDRTLKFYRTVYCCPGEEDDQAINAI